MMSPAARQLAGFLDAFEPPIAAAARAVLRRLRRRVPGAVQLVYDNYNALAIGFAPSERMRETVLSIAVFPRWVSLFFFQGKRLPDPAKRLRGTGNQVRHIVLEEGAATLDEPEVEALIAAALERADPRIDPAGRARLVIKAVSPTRRPRRPRR